MSLATRPAVEGSAGRAMPSKRILIVAVAVCVLLATAAVALAAESLSVTAAFSPDRLGAPTNVHGTATIHSTNELVPTPIIKTTVVGPAGRGLNVEGVGTCDPVKLETQLEPKACPTDSKAGFGGGTGVLELAKEVIKEHFTLNFFRGPNEDGHLVLLAFLNAISPVSVQLVLKAQVVKEPKPYGLGFTFVVPLIPTLPGASDASAEEIFITLGAPHARFCPSDGRGGRPDAVRRPGARRSGNRGRRNDGHDQDVLLPRPARREGGFRLHGPFQRRRIRRALAGAQGGAAPPPRAADEHPQPARLHAGASAGARRERLPGAIADRQWARACGCPR